MNNKVAICIITFHRTLGLKRLLESLQELQLNHLNVPDWKIIIVDNDPTMPNQGLINSYEPNFRAHIIYDKEETRGIASARNRCVELADDVDFVAFVDDDEVVDPSWLDELLLAQQTYNADVILGPVIPVYHNTSPRWFLTGRFLDRKRFNDGDELFTANSGNVLIKREWLYAIKGPFDERFNLTGGEDSLFFFQIHQLGAKIVWSNAPAIHEIVSRERVKSTYLIGRAYRVGSNRSRIEFILNASFKTILMRCIKGSYHILKGLFLLLPFLIQYRYTGLMKSFLFVSEGIGEILGFLGFQQKHYRKVNEIDRQ